jgi:hypothetical protein
MPDDAPHNAKAQARWQAVSDYLLLPMPWRGIE